MMKVDFRFKGLMVPVFTPFLEDKKYMIHYEMIDKYAHMLKTKGIHGVMVNGYTGEGFTMTVEERKKVAEEWFKVTRKYDLKMLLNIGGMSMPETYELAEHAEKLMVDAVMVMVDFAYKPYMMEDLIKYMKDIMMYMPTRPMFYYHMPMYTGYYFDFYKFYAMVDKEIKTFAGMYYADTDMDKALMLKKFDYNFIMGVGMSMMSVMAEGFDAFSMTAMNLYPEMFVEFYDLMKDYRMREAYMLKEKMFEKMYEFFKYDKDMDYITMMKMDFDKLYPSMKMGPVRKPKMMMNWWMKMLKW